MDRNQLPTDAELAGIEWRQPIRLVIKAKSPLGGTVHNGKAFTIRLWKETYAYRGETVKYYLAQTQHCCHQGQSVSLTAVRLKVEENQLVGVFGAIGVIVNGLNSA